MLVSQEKAVFIKTDWLIGWSDVYGPFNWQHYLGNMEHSQITYSYPMWAGLVLFQFVSSI